MGSEDVLFDEEDSRVVALLVEHVDSQIEQVFLQRSDVLTQYQLHHCCSSTLDLETLTSLLNIIDDNLSELYIAVQGADWKDDKRIEMRDRGLCYVWYTNELGVIVGFVSFSVVNEIHFGSHKTVLYLYEIHIVEQYQSLGLGSILLSAFHQFGAHLKLLHKNAPSEMNGILGQLFSTNLTVFADNTRAAQWYFKNGYTYTSDSPRPKLRSGKLPQLYLLYRPIS